MNNNNSPYILNYFSIVQGVTVTTFEPQFLGEHPWKPIG